MKHRFWPILSLVLALACGALLFLWQGERAEPDVDSLRFHGMTEAHARFSDYLRLGHEGDYWYGAAEFQTMVNCAAAENLSGPKAAWRMCAPFWRRALPSQTTPPSGRSP